MGEKPFGPRSTLGDAANAEPAAYLTRMEYSRSDHISCGTLRPRPVAPCDPASGSRTGIDRHAK